MTGAKSIPKVHFLFATDPVAQHPSEVPTMWIQGLWDQEDMWGAIHCYLALKATDQADHNYLVMGPWRHSQVNYDAYNLGPLKWNGDTARSGQLV